MNTVNYLSITREHAAKYTAFNAENSGIDMATAMASVEKHRATSKEVAMSNDMADGGGVRLVRNNGTLPSVSADSLVAVVDVRGMLLKDGSSFNDVMYYWYYGGTFLDQLGETLKALEANPAVSGVVLSVDSAGGHVDNTEMVAAIVRNFSKPTMAVVNNLCASAAYWIASQCDSIMISSRTAKVGSIGVMTTHYDLQAYYAESGITVTYLEAAQSPDKIVAPDNAPLSDDDRATVVKRLSDICEVFLTDVRAGRANIQDAALTGGVFLANEAITLGLVDSFGDVDAAVVAVVETPENDKIENQIENQNEESMLKQLASIYGLDENATAEQLAEAIAAERTANAKAIAELTAKVTALETSNDPNEGKEEDEQENAITAELAALKEAATKEKAELEARIKELELATANSAATKAEGKEKGNAIPAPPMRSTTATASPKTVNIKL